MSKKAEKFPQILIANRLSDGRVVWLSETGDWTEPSTSPLVLQDSPNLQMALSSAFKDEENNLIVSPIAIVVSDDLVPELRKYQIVLHGPTVRSDLGYQAENDLEVRHVSV